MECLYVLYATFTYSPYHESKTCNTGNVKHYEVSSEHQSYSWYEHAYVCALAQMSYHGPFLQGTMQGIVGNR